MVNKKDRLIRIGNIIICYISVHFDIIGQPINVFNNTIELIPIQSYFKNFSKEFSISRSKIGMQRFQRLLSQSVSQPSQFEHSWNT